MSVRDLLKILLILALCAMNLVIFGSMAWEFRTLDSYLYLVVDIIALITIFRIPFERKS